MRKLCKLTICICALLFTTTLLKGQQIGIKTNVLYWGTTTPNLGIEIGLSPRTTLDIQAGINPWTFGDAADNKKLHHFLIQPEFRYWFCERFNGSFVGLHAMTGSYNAGGMKLPFGMFPALQTTRYEGWFVGGGVSYGYQWFLSPHWNLELTLGVGYIYFKHDKYESEKCGEFITAGHRHYVGPTRLGLSFIYLFKSKK